MSEPLVPAAASVPVRAIFRRFWPYARPYRRWLWAMLAFVVVMPAISTAEIGLFKLTVDRVFVPRHFGPFLWLAAAFVGLNLLAGAIGWVQNYLAVWVGERFLLDLRRDFFRHVQGLSLDFFERRRLGDVLSRLTGDISSIETFVISGVASTLSYALRILFFAGALFYLSWELALVSLVVVPLFFAVARRFAEAIKRLSRERRRRSGSISAVAEESLSNIQLVQAYNREEAELDRFQRESLGSFRATMASARLRGLYAPLIDLIDLGGAMMVMALGTWELSRGRLSVGGLFAFLAFLSQLYSPVRRLSRMNGTFASAAASAERAIELLDQEPEVVD